MRVSFLLIVSTLLAFTGHAQNRVTLKQADQLKGGVKDGERYDRVLGNVIFTQNRTTIYCDSALFYRGKNAVEAFGHVRITEGDSLTITAQRAEYDGNERLARLRNKVVFTRLATATLYTDYLDFDRDENIAFYFNGGKLVDSINVLTSVKGYYQVAFHTASFKKNVDVKNPDFTMTADSLQYNTKSKVIFFRSETTVTDKEGNTAIYEGGEYNTNTRQSDLKKGRAETQAYTLTGTKIALDDLRKLYKVKGNAVMTSKEENLTIFGDEVIFDRLRNTGKVFGNAYVAKVTDDGDTLFMSADTLVSIDDADPAKKRLLAYPNVKIFKNDLQGTADSVEYRQADSTMFFYDNPVLWTQGNQLSADSLSLLIENNTLSKLHLVANAFIISTDTLKNFNQIKGRRMTADFRNKQLHQVVVLGNGESIYFALDEKTNALVGMNKIICSNITIRFSEGRVDNLSFYVKPEADFVPPHEIAEEETRLRGFRWREENRPTRNQVVKSPAPLPEKGEQKRADR